MKRWPPARMTRNTGADSRGGGCPLWLVEPDCPQQYITAWSSVYQSFFPVKSKTFNSNICKFAHLLNTLLQLRLPDVLPGILQNLTGGLMSNRTLGSPHRRKIPGSAPVVYMYMLLCCHELACVQQICGMQFVANKSYTENNKPIKRFVFSLFGIVCLIKFWDEEPFILTKTQYKWSKNQPLYQLVNKIIDSIAFNRARLFHQLWMYRVVQRTDTHFIYGITSVIQHRFEPLFHCYKQKFMVRKGKVLPPPHLYCVTTLPSKTNITANIGVVFCFID